eukprot:11212749-Ditylum_brightwellii.AAC.1
MGIKNDLVVEERLREMDPACRNESADPRKGHQQHLDEKEAATDKKKDLKKIVSRMEHHKISIQMYAILKRYLKPEDEGGTSHIMVPDCKVFQTKVQHTITAYNNKENHRCATLAAFLYYYIMDKSNGLKKCLPHKRIVNF